MTVADHRPMFGESGYRRQTLDAYWTPEWCTSLLLKTFLFRGRVWEPASGRGHICRVLARHAYGVCATDIADHGHHDRLANFLEERTLPREVETIITNPPYSDAEAFVRHALLLTGEIRGQVAMLLRNEFDCASSRVDMFDMPFACKLVLTKRPRWSEDNKASPRHNFAWFIWDWEHVGPPMIRHQEKTP